MSKTIGVIGLGSIGLRHAKNLEAMGHTVISHDPAQEGTHSLEHVINDSDALVIASPSDDHSFQILAAPAGMPLFVEKPIGVSGRDAIEIAAVLRHKKNTIMVGTNLRFHSGVKKSKEWLDAGLIGTPIWANFTCGQFNDKPAYLRDGVILNWGAHEIDLALYLLGPATVDASSTRLTDGKDDMTDILLTHDRGCRTSVHLDYVTEREVREFRIVGTEGQIEVDLIHDYRGADFRSNKNTKDGWVSHRIHYPGAGEKWHSFEENYIEEMQAFIDRIDGKETIGCTGEEGLEVLKICLEVRRQAGLT